LIENVKLAGQSAETKSAYSVTEAATFCGVSESFLNKARLAEKGPRFCRPAGCRRIVYRREDLERWLAGGTANDK
jgi:hypothetical protein